jgi:ADP-heptose:LPS heptosyltransferase
MESGRRNVHGEGEGATDAVHLPRRILLIQLRRLGDVVLSTALLEDLHRAFPDARLDYLVGPAAAPLLAGHLLIHERIVLDRTRTLAMWREIRSRRYDLVVDVQGNLRTAMIARASGAAVRVGWRSGPWRLWYTHACERRESECYVIRDRQRLLEMVGVPVGDSRPRIQLSRDELVLGEQAARAAGAPPDAPRVGFVITTSEPLKDWRIEAFGEVAKALSNVGVVPLVFELTPADIELSPRLCAIAPAAVVVPSRDLRLFNSVLATCRVLVSGDTGPAHMADALGVPRVTIFGATSPSAWSPGLPTTVAIVGARARVLSARERVRLDPREHDLTGDITPEMVLEPVLRLLNGGAIG